MRPDEKLRKRTYILLASMVCFSSLGNVLLSKGMKRVGEIVDFSPLALLAVFFRTFKNGDIWLGIFSLFLFFVSYLLLLSWADLSYVMPASAMGYGVLAVLGYLLLGEVISPVRWLGVLFICAGVALVGRTAPSTASGTKRSSVPCE
jgi:drug/metabolite transporter (DMT)-like permease